MNASSAKPWLRYSLIDGAVLEISMQESQAANPGEGILYVEQDLAISALDGRMNLNDYVVSLDDQTLIKRGSERYIRTMWHLDDVTAGSNSIEFLLHEDDGATLRRTDDHDSRIVIYVTREQDPNYLLSRHLLDRGRSPQKIYFDAKIPYSIYAGHHVD